MYLRRATMTDMMTENQNTPLPHNTMTSSTKSLLSKNEYMTIQANITTDDPITMRKVMTVQLWEISYAYFLKRNP